MYVEWYFVNITEYSNYYLDVNFGVEGSIGACLILAVVAIAIIWINRGRPECNDVWAELDVPKNPEQEA